MDVKIVLTFPAGIISGTGLERFLNNLHDSYANGDTGITLSAQTMTIEAEVDDEHYPLEEVLDEIEQTAHLYFPNCTITFHHELG